MLAELMKEQANVVLEENQLHTHREDEEEQQEEESKEESMIPTPIKNSGKYEYMNRDLHLDSPQSIEAEDSPFKREEEEMAIVQQGVEQDEQDEQDEQQPESNTPEKDGSEETNKIQGTFSVPRLDLNECEPDLTEEDDDEDEPLF